MKKSFLLIVISLFVTTAIAILGNIVANILQMQLDLSNPIIITIVLVTFFVCLVLLLYLDRKGSHDEINGQGSIKTPASSSGSQYVQKLYGKLTGIEIKENTGGEAKATQIIDTVGEGGEAVGIDGQKLSGGTASTIQKVNTVEPDGSVTGIKIDKL